MNYEAQLDWHTIHINFWKALFKHSWLIYSVYNFSYKSYR